MNAQGPLGVMLALAAFVVCSAIALLTSCDGPIKAGFGGIEADLQEKVQARLEGLGGEGSVTPDGRSLDVVIDRLPAGLTADELKSELEAEAGVRSVSIELGDGAASDDSEGASAEAETAEAAPATPTPEPTEVPEITAEPVRLSADIEAGTLSLAGQVQTADQLDEVLAGAEVGYDDLTSQVSSQGLRAGQDRDDQRTAAFSDALAAVGQQFTTATIFLEGDQLSVVGEALDPEALALVEDQLAGVGDAYDLNVAVQATFAGEQPDEEDEPSAPSSAAEQVAEIDLSGVNFESGTATLTAEAQAVLDETAVALIEVGDIAIEVQGHTDSTGDPDANVLLSQLRAEAVVNYLVSKGVDAESLTPQGYGAAEPIADNSTLEGQAENRRVELVVEGN